uniref:cyclic nucleotide-gated ion channel 1-like isoform X2 n=1 Tax=Fragaria vesca subsp. vesca TaxID=101020 RepID=UPI0005C9043D|nr:PREDICTED: cyclic nucleotide-gated ion channel 1-like isoform X2 [Fragaria vesca subsp. vesca]
MFINGHKKSQTFMQNVGRDDNIRVRMKMINFRLILHEYGLFDENGEMKRKIKLAVKSKLADDGNYIVENMFSILSLEEARSFVDEIKCALFFDKLKKVDGLQHKDDLVLKKICKHLKPVLYNESSYMIREGEPLDRMFFLTQGIVLIYDSSGFSRTVEVEEKSVLYGEELINWVETASSQESNLPFSTRTIKSHSLVEIFAIKVTDLQREVSLERHNVNNMLNDIEIC